MAATGLARLIAGLGQGRSSPPDAPSPTATPAHPVAGGLAIRNERTAAAHPTVTLPLAAELSYPLVRYGGHACTPLVHVGQHVLGGDALADGVVASTSGTIASIESRVPAHPSGLAVPTVVLRVDGRDAFRVTAHRDATDTIEPPQDHSTAALDAVERDRWLDVLRRGAVRGAGGAGFSTADKIAALDAPLGLLLINAVECEPGVACDTATVSERTSVVLDGVLALTRLTDARDVVIALEADNARMFGALGDALRAHPLTARLLLVPSVYPGGAERRLVRLATGRSLPDGTRAVDAGVLCFNVTTAATVADVLAGRPGVQRIVTVGGSALPESRNVLIRFGTTIDQVLATLHPTLDRRAANLRVRWGGPFSGITLPRLDVPVSATTHALQVEFASDEPSPGACIRCGACAEVCPERLQAQQLYRYARAGDLDGARRFGLEACITCGCCDAVCPAALPLTDLFRHLRATHRQQRIDSETADRHARRHAEREQRITQHETARAEAARRRIEAASDPTSAEAALARVRARRRARKPS